MTAPEVPSVTRVIDQARVDAYAQHGKDPNPIHRETPEAYAGPFGKPVAHGMLVLALASEAMAGAFGRAWAETGTLKIRWRSPAFPPIRVTARCTPKSDVAGLFAYDVVCEDEAGEPLLTGTATVRPSTAS